jgi:long-chain acyl-CoA synthetase
LFYGAYDATRALRRSTAGTANHYGSLLLHAERKLHVAPEHLLNQLLWHLPGLAVPSAYFYATLHFFIVDRRKDLIITAGYNVYPAEIERVIAGHSAVAMVAVGPIPDDVKGELACAYIVVREGAVLTEDEVMDYTRDKLAAYKRPRRIVFVKSLPATSTGRIMRRMLAGAQVRGRVQ